MNKVLYTPGPTNVPNDIREELQKDMIHHRTKNYADLLKNLTKNLSDIFRTKEEVLTLTSSGTGVMEASVVNLFSKGDKVLVINAGYFGDRFGKMAKVYGLDLVELVYPWGETYKLEDVKEVIENNPDLKGIFVQYSETSTGVLHNVENLGKLTKEKDILLIVDVISGLVVNEFEFDKWGIDCAIAGSQKGFLLPPGLAFLALSCKAREAMEKSDLPKFYFDLKKYYLSLKKGQNPWTPAIGLIVAADYSCKKILEQGLENIQAHSYKLRNILEKELSNLGFSLFVKDPSARGNTLISVENKNIDTEEVKKILDQKYNFSIAGGQGDYIGKMLRVGTLGELTVEDINNLISAIKDILETK